MIVFLNFIPIHFMGGAEKWMIDMAEFTDKTEKTVIVDVAKSITNFYAKLVLKREIKNNFAKHRKYNFNNITTFSIKSFIPFTKEWYQARQLFQEARITYLRFELPEIFIFLYFNGLGGLKKAAAGLHMSIYYEQPKGFFQQLHNVIYTSAIFKFFLARVQTVHVINRRDEKFLKHHFKLTNVQYVPNGTEVNPKLKPKDNTSKSLNLIFVGELSERKGVDTVIETIKVSPNSYQYQIVGRGPLQSEIESLSRNSDNCHHHDYVSVDKLHTLYENADVMFFPSRAEAFGLVMIEALARGLVVVNTSEVKLDLPVAYEKTVEPREARNFLKTFNLLHQQKLTGKINRQKIVEYCYEHFSTEKIYPLFAQKILALK